MKNDFQQLIFTLTYAVLETEKKKLDFGHSEYEIIMLRNMWSRDARGLRPGNLHVRCGEWKQVLFKSAS